MSSTVLVMMYLPTPELKLISLSAGPTGGGVRGGTRPEPLPSSPQVSLLLTELGTSLFEIAQERGAIERTLILGAMALLDKKSEAQWANWQNQILSDPLKNDTYKDKRAP